MEWSWIDVLWHVLAYPIYQILGTLRHELCHAAAAKAFGATITELSVLPCRRDGQWYWGYTRWVGDLTGDQRSAVRRAPYAIDVLLIAVWFILFYPNEFESFHLFAFTAVMLLVSPVADIVYNMVKALVWRRGDLAD